MVFAGDCSLVERSLSLFWWAKFWSGDNWDRWVILWIPTRRTRFFYLITGLHGVHLLGGLVAWFRASVRLWRGAEVAKIRMSVELCAVYWHFLLVVWLVMFGLLLVT